jgi:uncharacterized protein
MSFTGWREAVVEYIRVQAQPADKFGHQPRVYALARRIGEGMEYDDDILFAAAWMHDLGVFPGHRPSEPEMLERWNHIPYTVARARDLLAGWGFPAAKLDAVAEAIENHQPDDEPRRMEGVLLRDADILEQLGAVGALRTVTKVGRDTRYPTFSSVIPVLRNAADALPSRLRTKAARLLAAQRVQTLNDLLAALQIEAGELLL